MKGLSIFKEQTHEVKGTTAKIAGERGTRILRGPGPCINSKKMRKAIATVAKKYITILLQLQSTGSSMGKPRRLLLLLRLQVEISQ